MQNSSTQNSSTPAPVHVVEHDHRLGPVAWRKWRDAKVAKARRRHAILEARGLR